MLIVDDEEVIQSVPNNLFSEAGYNVIITSNGQEAVRLYKMHADNIKLILTDIMMPYKDGIKAAYEMFGFNPNISICLMRGYIADANGGTPIYDLISKPFLPAKLMQKIRVMLDSS